jgi:outer membrane protein
MLLKVSLSLSTIAIISVIALALFVIDTNEKFVYVDSGKLLAGYKGMQAAREGFEKKSMVWQSNIDTLRAEVKQEISKYEAGLKSMTTRERQLSQELIRNKQKQLIDYQKALSTQANEEDQRLNNMVVADVNAYLQKYGKEKGYKIVMAATNYGNIAYAEEGLDITSEVLDGLNAEYKAIK